MFRKILYPTDFSDVSKIAIEYIKQLKESGVKEILVLHVIDERDAQFNYLYIMDEYTGDKSLKQRLENEARKGLTEIKDKLKDFGFKITARIEFGVPLKEILKAEQEEDISIIIIGSHGKSNVAEMLLGSVSEKVVRKCKKPVLVVKR